MPYLSREKCGLVEPTRITALPTQPATHVYVHHGATSVSGSLADADGDGAPDAEEATWRGYQRYHMQTRGWSDIAYSYGVGLSGWRYEGRGWGRQSGATGSPEDRYSYSMCAIGNYDKVKPSDAMIAAYVRQISNGIAKGHIVPHDQLKILGHKDKGGTSCPGKYLYADIPRIIEGVALVFEGPTTEPEPLTLEERVERLEDEVFG